MQKKSTNSNLPRQLYLRLWRTTPWLWPPLFLRPNQATSHQWFQSSVLPSSIANHKHSKERDKNHGHPKVLPRIQTKWEKEKKWKVSSYLFVDSVGGLSACVPLKGKNSVNTMSCLLHWSSLFLCTLVCRSFSSLVVMILHLTIFVVPPILIEIIICIYNNYFFYLI